MAKRKTRKNLLSTIVRRFSLDYLLVGAIVLLAGTWISEKINSEKIYIAPRHAVFPLTPTPIPSATPFPTATPYPVEQTYTQPAPINSTNPWGVATHVEGPQWSIKLGADARMATAQEIFMALNTYRNVQGKSTLIWSDTLANYALTRAASFSTAGKLDDHAGINDFLKNQDGFNKLGFNSVGENAALLGEPLLGVHIIEWVFAGDPEHNANQLDSQWSYVGVGVSGFGVDVVFGGNKQ
ncbi:MAG TPA: CAP domain-containing protein [Patescibacteria group bacterium]|nr:CAP domain-containing protein [Patescibacteria group bacterium]